MSCTPLLLLLLTTKKPQLRLIRIKASFYKRDDMLRMLTGSLFITGTTSAIIHLNKNCSSCYEIHGYKEPL